MVTRWLMQLINKTHLSFNPEDTDPYRDLVMDNLLREPFDSQRQAVHAISSLLFDHGEKAAVLNAEMGTGKDHDGNFYISRCTSGRLSTIFGYLSTASGVQMA